MSSESKSGRPKMKIENPTFFTSQQQCLPMYQSLYPSFVLNQFCRVSSYVNQIQSRRELIAMDEQHELQWGISFVLNKPPRTSRQGNNTPHA